MRCNNCRCVIPDRSDYCVYCGHAIPLGDEVTYRAEYSGNPRRDGTYPSSYPLMQTDDYYRYENDYPYGYASYRNPPVHRQNDSRDTQWNFSLINEDGSLNYLKTLLLLAGFDICFILILLLLILLMLL